MIYNYDVVKILCKVLSLEVAPTVSSNVAQHIAGVQMALFVTKL